MRHGVTLALILIAATASNSRTAEPQKPADPPLRIETMTHRYRYENDGTGVYELHGRTRILNAAGRQAMVQFPIAYASASQEGRFVSLKVLKSDGSAIEANLDSGLDVAHPYTQQAPQYSDLKVIVLPVPAVELGEAIEYRAEIRTTRPIAPGQFWALHYASKRLPVDEEIVILDLPEDRAVSFSADPLWPSEISRADGRIIRRWRVANPTVASDDAKPEDAPRALFMVSTLRTFEILGAWYLDLQKNGSTLDDGGRALVHRLIEGKASARAKVAALHEYVAQSIRYLSLSFGIGGYRPHPVAEVLRNGYGDCKDKDALLRAMLAAAGIESRPAIVNARWGILDETVPNPGQFDHVMTVAYPDGAAIWLDATLEVAPMGVVAPSLYGRKVFVAGSPGTGLIDVAHDGAPLGRKTTRTKGSLDASGVLSTTTSHEVQGRDEVPLRMAVRAGAPADRLYASYLALSYDTADPESTEIVDKGDPTDLSKPFSFTFRGKDASWVSLTEARVERSIPGIPDDPGDTFLTERLEKLDPSKPIDLRGRYESLIESEIVVDPAWEVTLPVAVSVEKPFASWTSRYAFVDGKLIASRLMKIAVREVPASEKDAVSAFAAVVQRDAAQTAVFRRRSAVDVGAAAESLDADALHDAGLVALADGRPALAAELFEKAVAKAPQHKFAWNSLGLARFELRDLDKAEAAYRRQIEIAPNDPWAYNNRGRVLAARGRIDEAIAMFQKQIEIDPLDAWSHQNLGRALAQQGDWQRAQAALARAVELAPEDGSTQAMLANALLVSGQDVEGRSHMEQAAALEMAPSERLGHAVDLERRKAWPEVAERLARRAMDDAASTMGQLTLNSVPEGYYFTVGVLGHGHSVLGKLAMQQGRLDQATEHLRLAYDVTQSRGVAADLSRVLARRGKYEEALLYYSASDRFLAKDRPEMPTELRRWLKTSYPDAAGLERKLGELRRNEIDLRLVPAPPGGWKLPKQYPGNNGVEFDVRVLVDESGQVVDMSVRDGKEPWKAAATADLKRTRFKPLTASGRSLRSLRDLHFFYLPGSLVRAFWSFSIDEAYRSFLETIPEISVGGSRPAAGPVRSKRRTELPSALGE